MSDYDALLHSTGATPTSHALALHPGSHPAAMHGQGVHPGMHPGAHPGGMHPGGMHPGLHAMHPSMHGGATHPVHDARALAQQVAEHLGALQGGAVHARHDDDYAPRRGRDRDHDNRHDRHERDHERRRNDEDEGYERRRSKHATLARQTRNFPIGFIYNNIPAGQNQEIEVKPQVRFQGHRLAVAPSCARYFNIVDMKVGKDSQLAATGEMPAESFSSLSVGTQVELDPAPPGIVITLIVHNTDTAAQNFGAVLYGVVEERNED
jgi:hypothetical protein